MILQGTRGKVTKRDLAGHFKRGIRTLLVHPPSSLLMLEIAQGFKGLDCWEWGDQNKFGEEREVGRKLEEPKQRTFFRRWGSNNKSWNINSKWYIMNASQGTFEKKSIMSLGRKKRLGLPWPSLLAGKKTTEQLHHTDSFTLWQASDKIIRWGSLIPSPTVTFTKCAVSKIMKAAWLNVRWLQPLC